jgi:uncharacterized lipoprotein
MRKRLQCIFLFLSLACFACSWTSEQKEILDSFEETLSTLETGNWQAACGMLSRRTTAYLDSTSSMLTGMGLAGYETDAELLEVMYDEYIDFDGEVTMIFVQGETAEITLSSDESEKYTMRMEDGVWKLDLAEIFRRSLRRALEGSYVDS